MEKEETKSIELVDLYAKAQDDLKFNGDKAWESVKLCITLSSTLITIVLGLLGVINYFSINILVKVVLILALIPFPIMMASIVYFLFKNFKRECRRMYENMSILMKIEDELPQRKDVSKDRNFNEENDYIPSLWKGQQYAKTEDFVKATMSQSDRFYSNMQPIFSALKCFSYMLLGIIFIIASIVILSAFWNELISIL